MLLYNHMAVFSAVIQAGNFTRAAEQLKLPKSTVSLKVAQLEEELGIKLLQRTTRQLTLTEQGKQFYQHCRRMQQLQDEPHGMLRVSGPFGMTCSPLPEILSTYSQRYPGVKLELLCSNDWIDLIAGGFDVALRAGPLQDSSLIVRELGPVRRLLLASPEYVRDNKPLRVPDDVRQHPCIVSAYTTKWTFVGTEGAQTITPEPHVLSNDLDMIRELLVKGVGIGTLPASSLGTEVEDGLLVPLLENFPLEQRTFNLVYPSRKLQSVNLKRFIEIAVALYERSDFIR